MTTNKKSSEISENSIERLTTQALFFSDYSPTFKSAFLSPPTSESKKERALYK